MFIRAHLLFLTMFALPDLQEVQRTSDFNGDMNSWFSVLNNTETMSVCEFKLCSQMVNVSQILGMILSKSLTCRVIQQVYTVSFIINSSVCLQRVKRKLQ